MQAFKIKVLCYCYFFSIDGTVAIEEKLIVFANDDNANFNCKAKSIKYDDSKCPLPFIVTMHDIARGEEITYNYGNYKFEWRNVIIHNYL